MFLCKKVKKYLEYNYRPTRHLSTDTLHFELYGGGNGNEEEEEEEDIVFDMTRV